MDGEAKLLMALLENAQSAYRRGNRQEVEEWVLSEDRSYPSAFINVCEMLGLEPKAARGHILTLRPRWRPDAHTAKEYTYRWRAKNRQKWRDYMKKWKAANAEKARDSTGNPKGGSMILRTLFLLLSLFIATPVFAAVTLSWEYADFPGSPATAIEIHRKDPLAAPTAPAANYQMIGTVAPTVRTYVDQAVTDDGTARIFCYKVRAVGASGVSNFSNEACTLYTPKNLKVTITITVP